jgi:molecular chaperone GrpE
MVDDIGNEKTAKDAESAAPQEPAARDLAVELAEAKKQAEQYLDQMRRVAAVFSNYRKRADRDREESSRFSCALLLTRLLPILDDLGRAEATLPPDLRQFTWVDGISLIERKLWLTLEAEGLKAIEVVGQPFDPLRHEAILREEKTSAPDGQVLAELQRGYELRGKVLRPALVKVAVRPAPAPPAEEPAPPGTDEAKTE